MTLVHSAIGIGFNGPIYNFSHSMVRAMELILGRPFGSLPDRVMSRKDLVGRDCGGKTILDETYTGAHRYLLDKGGMLCHEMPLGRQRLLRRMASKYTLRVVTNFRAEGADTVERFLGKFSIPATVISAPQGTKHRYLDGCIAFIDGDYEELQAAGHGMMRIFVGSQSYRDICDAEGIRHAGSLARACKLLEQVALANFRVAA
jgi:hypothetical protein